MKKYRLYTITTIYMFNEKTKEHWWFSTTDKNEAELRISTLYNVKRIYPSIKFSIKRTYSVIEAKK